MVFDISKVKSFGPFTQKTEKDRMLLYKEDKVFLVLNKNTVEIRTDQKLAKLLIEKYESVMESRYFGHGGLEIVPSSQLPESDLLDLIRLSYNLT